MHRPVNGYGPGDILRRRRIEGLEPDRLSHFLSLIDDVIHFNVFHEPVVQDEISLARTAVLDLLRRPDRRAARDIRGPVADVLTERLEFLRLFAWLLPKQAVTANEHDNHDGECSHLSGPFSGYFESGKSFIFDGWTSKSDEPSSAAAIDRSA